MRRVERHIILRSDPNWNIIDKLCFIAKNLYNRANYLVRQLFINSSKKVEEGKRSKAIWTRYVELDRIAKEENWKEYRELPAQTSQQVLRLLEKNWKSFFKTIKEWIKDKSKFKGRPKLPKYKNEGRTVVIFTAQQIKLKGQYIHFPKKVGLSPIKTKVDNIKQVRLIPQSTCYVIEVVYEKKKEDDNLDAHLFLGIDIGLNNLATLTSNKKGLRPILINGRPLKSINQFFNKVKSKLMSFIKDRGTSKRILKLTHKRGCKIQDYLHKASRFIIRFCLLHSIKTIVIGINKNWKQEVTLGKRNNQNFVAIPFATLIQQLQYKAEEVGIKVILTEEAYTSKSSFLDLEVIEKKENYKGRRIKRGLFRSSSGKLINADVNGAFNILRKVVPNLFRDGIEGVGLHPIKVSF